MSDTQAPLPTPSTQSEKIVRDLNSLIIEKSQKAAQLRKLKRVMEKTSD